jgi:predicted transcriptional regulator of viral defense system
MGDKSHHQPARRDAVIAEIAARQHGVVTIDQLRDLDLGRRGAHERIAAGRLHPVHQGVYAVGHARLTREGRYMAAVLACGPGAVLSHRSAADLWGLRRNGRNRIDVTAPRRRGRSRDGIDAHRDGSLMRQDRTLVDGIPCTSPSRTLLDLAAVANPRQLRNALTAAEVLRLLDLRALDEVIDRSRGRRGVARLRRALAEYDPAAEQAHPGLERSFLALCRRADLPSPAVNAPVDLPDGSQVVADFLWRDARLVVETDDRRSHETASAFQRDRRRDQLLAAEGWRVVRCTWTQVTSEPKRLAATIRMLLTPTRAQRATGETAAVQ